MSHIPYYGQTENRVEYNSFTDEYYITIPDDIIEHLNLVPGDVLVWTIAEGKVYIAKR
jgi:bifunctional DNA-binding transcriptional regulator/antitoxin component of YhaV-PrlF toxin-antitoxin module